MTDRLQSFGNFLYTRTLHNSSKTWPRKAVNTAGANKRTGLGFGGTNPTRTRQPDVPRPRDDPFSGEPPRETFGKGTSDNRANHALSLAV